MVPARFGMALAAALLLAGFMASGPVPPAPWFHRGVNFTAEWPDVYASDRSRQMLRQLRDYGVNAVALVPYGFNRLGQPAVRYSGNRFWERDADIETTARAAHHLGMRVLLKPQLWVGGGYPGDLDFADAADRAEWFRQYGDFVRHYAQLATRIRAEVFCVGVEFSRLSRHEAEWRELIRLARRHYSGPLVYAANWGQEFESIRFWDAVDYIGLNNYYPLPDNLDVSAVVAKVERVHRRFRRPVLFPEAGFSSLTAPHRQPWDETPRALSPAEQARCYEAVFRAFYDKPWFQGVYWWKIGSNGFGGTADGSHTPWGKPAMEVVRRWYTTGGR